MVFSLKELNELYYALCIAHKNGHFTNYDLNEYLQFKIKTVINDYHLTEE